MWAGGKGGEKETGALQYSGRVRAPTWACVARAGGGSVCGGVENHIFILA